VLAIALRKAMLRKSCVKPAAEYPRIRTILPAIAAAIRELRNDQNRLIQMGIRAKETAAKYARVDELERLSKS